MSSNRSLNSPLSLTPVLPSAWLSQLSSLALEEQGMEAEQGQKGPDIG